MFCVHVAGDELDALTHDFRQNGFAISVNGCHLGQINDAPPRVPCFARFSPTRLELRRPRADQLTQQRPPLFIEQVGYSDLQQYFPSTACQKPPTSEGTRRTLVSEFCAGPTARSQRLTTYFDQTRVKGYGS